VVNTYELGALAIVIAVPFAIVLIITAAVGWATDAVRRSAVVGGLGVLATLVAIGYLFVEQTCELTRNRPIIMAVVGPGDCRRTGFVAIELVLLLAVATALAVRLPDVVNVKR
jgi:hypothetical protein